MITFDFFWSTDSNWKLCVWRCSGLLYLFTSISPTYAHFQLILGPPQRPHRSSITTRRAKMAKPKYRKRAQSDRTHAELQMMLNLSEFVKFYHRLHMSKEQKKKYNKICLLWPDWRTFH